MPNLISTQWFEYATAYNNTVFCSSLEFHNNLIKWIDLTLFYAIFFWPEWTFALSWLVSVAMCTCHSFSHLWSLWRVSSHLMRQIKIFKRYPSLICAHIILTCNTDWKSISFLNLTLNTSLKFGKFEKTVNWFQELVYQMNILQF